MSLAPAAMAGQRLPSPSPTGSTSFSSNNPFRRTASPAPPSPDEASRVRMNNNPFLDPPSQPVQRQAGNPFSEDLFKDLSILDQPGQTAQPPSRSDLAKPGTMQPQHRPMRSQGDDPRRRGPGPPRGPPRPSDAQNKMDSSLQSKSDSRRPRRNSDSSIMDRDKDEERRRRRKEREERREKEGRSKDGKAKPTKRPQGLDLIDKLDVTGIYGQGLFHHDGPFDACNPHRNRKKDNRAPMQAFPVDSANNALGGSGPLNKNIDLDRFHGRGEDAFNDYSHSKALAANPAKQPVTYHPTERVEQVHGEATHGLGTSTFLEGAPASRKAIQRRESETEATAFNGGGLSRKKSLAVRLRGLSQNRRGLSSDRIMSPDVNNDVMSPSEYGQKIQSAGGVPRTRVPPGSEKNPFFADYDDAYEKKGAQIRLNETSAGASSSSRVRDQNSPNGNGLVRSITADSVTTIPKELPEKPVAVGGGFLNRMKSLKGGRRPRPERREA